MRNQTLLSSVMVLNCAWACWAGKLSEPVKIQEPVYLVAAEYAKDRKQDEYHLRAPLEIRFSGVA